MRRALLLTAYNRPEYLREVLNSWSKVREIESWPMHILIDPSPHTDAIIQVIRSARLPVARLGVTVNPTRFGVLRNPYVGFDRLFNERLYDFVFRAEDDIVVSTDTLEYVTWASNRYQYDDHVAIVQAASAEPKTADPRRIVVDGSFSPWDFGTWRRWWNSVIKPTWDLDYSTNSGTPGHHAGWDWNLTERVLPARGLHVCRPAASRSDSIGIIGTHSTPSIHQKMPSFVPERPSFYEEFAA
jgi:hypothetical protein